MSAAGNVKLIEIDWPDFGPAEAPAAISLGEYQSRLSHCRARMVQMGLSHLVVYADREHFANLTYLTGFDPRFEEALLIIGGARKPLLVVDNECEGYLPVSPLFQAGELRSEVYQPFSLLDQPRDKSRLMRDILADEGIGLGSLVGCTGWKYFGENEHPDAAHAIEIPAYIVDTLRALAGHAAVINANSILMNAADGLRAIASPAEIAYFEYTNALAADSLRQMIFGLREGMVDHELMALAGLNGIPLGCHPTLATGDHWQTGLYSPTGQIVRRGSPLSTNVCYWGSNICRAGWVAESATDLPDDAQDYIEQFAAPYFATMADWFAHLTIGRPGGELWQLIQDQLPFDKFGIFLNPGHLIHYDEWLSSPIYEGSAIPLASGMVFQVDVIPFSTTYSSTRMEDGVALADARLRQKLAEAYPAAWARIEARRTFMADVLGIPLPEEVLPLSNMPAIISPFLLAPRQVLALQS